MFPEFEEGREYQDDSSGHRQPFPEPVLEEEDFDPDNHGSHQDDVECGGHLDSHFSSPVYSPNHRRRARGHHFGYGSLAVVDAFGGFARST
jgi:hypothetical protein